MRINSDFCCGLGHSAGLQSFWGKELNIMEYKIIVRVSACGVLLPVCGTPQQRGTSLVQSRDSFSREFFGEQQECGEVLPALVRDGVLQLWGGFSWGPCALQMMNKVFGGTVHKKSVREDGVFSITLDNTCSLFRCSHISSYHSSQSGKLCLDERKVIFKKKAKLADNF